jgi:hypothetical protein
MSSNQSVPPHPDAFHQAAALLVSIGPTPCGAFEGKVTWVDPEGKSFLIKTTKGVVLSVKVDKETKYVPKEKSCRDLQEGDEVHSTGHHPWKPPEGHGK